MEEFQRWQQINVKLHSGADKKEILQDIQDLADDGFKDAQELLGSFYYQGNEYVQLDKRKAYEYYQKAARQGEDMEQAQYRAYLLANELEIGVPITEVSESFQLLKMSADHKFPAAVIEIASLYVFGNQGKTSIKTNIRQGLHYINLLSESELKAIDKKGTIKKGIDVLRMYVKQQYPDVYREYYKNVSGNVNGVGKAPDVASGNINKSVSNSKNRLSIVMSVASVMMSILALYAGSEIRSMAAVICIAILGMGCGIQGVRHGSKKIAIVGVVFNLLLVLDGLIKVCLFALV